MKRKLFTLLVAGFVFVFVLVIAGTLPVQGEGNQVPTPQYVSGAQHPELTAFLDGGDPVPICFPGDQKCSIRFDGPSPVPICYPGDQKCGSQFDGTRLEPIYFSDRSYAAKLLDGPVPEPICFPGDQKCK